MCCRGKPSAGPCQRLSPYRLQALSRRGSTVNRSCRRYRWLRPLREALLLTAAVAMAGLPAVAAEIPTRAATAPDSDGEELYLEVVLNQARNGQLSRFIR